MIPAKCTCGKHLGPVDWGGVAECHSCGAVFSKGRTMKVEIEIPDVLIDADRNLYQATGEYRDPLKGEPFYIPAGELGGFNVKFAHCDGAVTYPDDPAVMLGLKSFHWRVNDAGIWTAKVNGAEYLVSPTNRGQFLGNWFWLRCSQKGDGSCADVQLARTEEEAKLAAFAHYRGSQAGRAAFEHAAGCQTSKNLLEAQAVVAKAAADAQRIRIANVLGVNPASYSIAELVVMKNARLSEFMNKKAVRSPKVSFEFIVSQGDRLYAQHLAETLITPKCCPIVDHGLDYVSALAMGPRAYAIGVIEATAYADAYGQAGARRDRLQWAKEGDGDYIAPTEFGTFYIQATGCRGQFIWWLGTGDACTVRDEAAARFAAEAYYSTLRAVRADQEGAGK